MGIEATGHKESIKSGRGQAREHGAKALADGGRIGSGGDGTPSCAGASSPHPPSHRYTTLEDMVRRRGRGLPLGPPRSPGPEPEGRDGEQ